MSPARKTDRSSPGHPPPAAPGAPVSCRPRPGPRDECGPGPRQAPVSAPALVDADVAAAVDGVLESVLRDRVAQATRLDPVFGSGVAERLARFALCGGKRLRARFLWWGMRACAGSGGAPEDDGRTAAALRLAAALELIQVCALVQDDVMDGSPVRRGRPALHTELADRCPERPPAGLAFGAAAAVLAGDLALVWADDLAACPGPSPAADEAVRALWRALRTEMIAGQYLDLRGQSTAGRSPDEAVRTACLKSARYTVERPLGLGAALAGADPVVTGALCAAGRLAGTAFQLRDDLRNAFGGPGTSGKPAGDDLRNGKPTYLLAVACARARAQGRRADLALLRRRPGPGGFPDAEVARLRAVLDETGARRAVEQKIEQLVADGERQLAAARAEPAAGGQLRALMRSSAGLPADGGEGSAR